jgi:hypothetical protein
MPPFAFAGGEAVRLVNICRHFGASSFLNRRPLVIFRPIESLPPRFVPNHHSGFPVHVEPSPLSRIARLFHLVARDEKRSLFPVTTIKVPGAATLPDGWEERIYPGVHSDLGGGYGNSKSRQEQEAYEADERFREERELHQASAIQSEHQSEKPNLAKLEAEAPRACLSRIPFWVMYDLASQAGVPVHKLETVLPPPADAHSPDWWHLAPEEEKRKATWVRFSGWNDSVLARLEIPPKLRNYWERRHLLAEEGRWAGADSELEELSTFQHDSLYLWENHHHVRQTKDRGVMD